MGDRGEMIPYTIKSSFLIRLVSLSRIPLKASLDHVLSTGWDEQSAGELPQLQLRFKNAALHPASRGLCTKREHLTRGLPLRSCEITGPRS